MTPKTASQDAQVERKDLSAYIGIGQETASALVGPGPLGWHHFSLDPPLVDGKIGTDVSLNNLGGVGCMSVLNIRDFPEDVYRALKIKAATDGKSLRAVVIELLSEAVKKKGAKQ